MFSPNYNENQREYYNLPATPNYMDTTPTYVTPTFTPSYTPSYTPNYTPITPNYTQPTITSTFTPIYKEPSTYTPIYKEPSTYTPNYMDTSYHPSTYMEPSTFTPNYMDTSYHPSTYMEPSYKSNLTTFKSNDHEISPLGKAGNSHFGYVDDGGYDPGWHVTTDIKGFGKKEGFNNGYSHHDFLSDF